MSSDVDASLPSPPGLADLIAELDRRSPRNVSRLPSDIEGGEIERFVQLSLAGARYAVPVEKVMEVAEVPRITPVPRVPEWVLGVTNLRGEVLAVLDLRLLLDLSCEKPVEACRMLVARDEGGRAGEEAIAGLIVDDVQGALRLDPALKQPPVAVEGKVSRFLMGLIQDEDQQVLSLLDLAELMRSSDVRQFEAL